DQKRWDYFDQMTGDANIPDTTVRNRKGWTQKNGQSSEEWDCEVYALHAASAKRAHPLKRTDCDVLRKSLLQRDVFSTAGEPPEATGGGLQRRKSDYWKKH